MNRVRHVYTQNITSHFQHLKEYFMNQKIQVLYGTESGNAQYCAEILGDELTKLNIEHEVTDMGLYEPTQILQERFVIVITSTHGNGDAPANAEKMLKYLQDNQVDLSQTKFTVCALGDSSFLHFAQCGKDFDEVLGQRNAQRVLDRVDCDADFDDEFDEFLNQITSYLSQS